MARLISCCVLFNLALCGFGWSTLYLPRECVSCDCYECDGELESSFAYSVTTQNGDK